MDVSVSKEFINVYKQISKLQDDIAKVGKDCLGSTLSCDDLPDIPDNLSDFKNDAGFVTNDCVDNKITQTIENVLVKDGSDEQKCNVPTEFKELHAITKDADDSSTNVATTQFVHNIVKSDNEHIIACMANKKDIENLITIEDVLKVVNKSEVICKDYTDELINIEDEKVTEQINEAIQQIDVPTKTSDLNNDSGFITINDIPDDLVTSVNGKTGDVQIDIPTVPTNLSAFNNDVGYITDPGVISVNNRTGAVSVLENVLADWSATSGLALILHKPALKRVATTGDYNDLDNLPIIPIVPTNISAFTNDVGYITTETDPTVPSWAKQQTKPTYTALEVGALPSDTLLFSGDYNDLTNKPTIPVVPTNVSDFTNDADYITVTEVDDLLSDKQDVIGDLSTIRSGAAAGATAILTETDPVFSASVAAGIQSSDIANWNSKTSNIGTVTGVTVNGVLNTPDQNGIVDIGSVITSHQDISCKYDKTGGNISGNVDIDGTLKLNIADDDYESAITMSARLDDNLGTILTLTGNADSTQYRTVLRNIATPNSNYDAANKKYVDDHILVPNYYLVELNIDGSVHLKASSLTYSTVSANLTNPTKADYLDVFWENGAGTDLFTRFYAKAVEIVEVNSGDIKFIGDVEYAGIQRRMVFTLDNNDVLTTTSITTSEIISNKKNSVVNNLSDDYYASTNAIYNEFLRKPVTIWETSGTGLLSSELDIKESMTWQLTGLDMSPYKRVKIYTKAGKKTSGIGQDASNTPAVILEMSLDSRAAGPTGGHFMGSVVGLKPNDANRLFTVTCAISADKTSFAVLRMSTLYGTAATANSDCNGYVFKIEGYYD